MNTQERTPWSKYQKELLNFVRRRVKDKVTAEDIVQEVIIKMYTRRDQLKDDSKITSWMYQITRHAIIDHYRESQRSIEQVGVDSESSNRLNDCVANCLTEMLGTLPGKYREAIEWADQQQQSQIDLAAKLNISYSGLKSRVQRARQMLKEKMEALYNIKTDSYGNIIVCENRIPCNCPGWESEADQ